MEQLTLEQAAAHYAKMLFPGASESNANHTNALGDFKAGAEWQKNKYNTLLRLTADIINSCAKNHSIDPELLHHYHDILNTERL